MPPPDPPSPKAPRAGALGGLVRLRCICVFFQSARGSTRGAGVLVWWCGGVVGGVVAWLVVVWCCDLRVPTLGLGALFEHKLYEVNQYYVFKFRFIY